MLSLLVSLIIIMLVLGVAWWIVTLIPLPHPIGLIVRVIFVLIALIVVIDLLMGLAGSSRLIWR